jgi:DNA-binding CsgD family transcriptional regulator
MPNKLKQSGILFAVVFALGFAVNFVSGIVQHHSIAYMFFAPGQILCVGGAILFVLSAYIEKLRWIQPAVFLLTSPFAIIPDSRGIYGLGFFIMGVLLLERAGYFEKHRLLKVFTVVAYLFAIEVGAVIYSHLSIMRAISVLFFIVSFGVFLWFLYKDRLVVIFKEPKPRISLAERGLSLGEQSFVKLTIAGKSQKELAFDFELSESTVRNTLSRAYKKLGVDDRIGLAVLSERYQLED